MKRVTHDGVRVHDSIRQNGGPETARRVLVVGHTDVEGDFFHLDAQSAQELRAALDEFLTLPAVSGGGARWTSGDSETYSHDRNSR